MKKFLWLVVLLTLPAWAQFPASVTVQEALPYIGGAYPPGVARSNYPVSFSFPLKQGDAPAPTPESHMGLAGAGLGQFRCLGFYADGSCMWMQVDTEMTSFAAGASDTSLQVSNAGGGNFGGANLASDNGTSITVNTGAATFTIQKSGYDIFHSVVVNGKTIVNGGSDGMVIVGPDTSQAMPAPPAAAPVTGAAGGGSFGARTYFAAISCVGMSGETVTGPVSAAIGVGAGQLLSVSGAGLCGANSTGYMVYVGTVSNSLHLQTLVPISTAGAWTEPAACPFSGGADCFPGTAAMSFTHMPLAWSGHSDGCPSPGNCTTVYKSAFDINSTALIEENGPVKAVIKATGSFASTPTACAVAGQTPNCYLHWTTRMYFYRNQKFVRVMTMLRNADNAPGDNATHYASDFKGFSSYEMRIHPYEGAGGLAPGTKAYKFGTFNGGMESGSLDGSNDAYLYQAYSTFIQLGDNTQTCVQPTNCYASPILQYPDASKFNGNSWAQEGYAVHVNGAVCSGADCTGDRNHPAQGWADISDSSGAGIETGSWYMAGYWPKALQFKQIGAPGSSMYDVYLDLLPQQSMFNSSGQSYYVGWPEYQIYDTFFQFHDSALASPANDFLSYQYFLIGRATSVNTYNRTGVFPPEYPLMDPTLEDTYLKSINAKYCCLNNPNQDKAPVSVRRAGFSQGGEGNQHEEPWAYLRNWLERGMTGRFLFPLTYYRYYEETGVMRADGFSWRSHCGSVKQPGCTSIELNAMGFPGYPGGIQPNGHFPVGNGNLGSREPNSDDEHAHFWGIADMYFLTGDETLHDFLNQAWVDYGANPYVGRAADFPVLQYSANRAVSGRVLHSARLYTYLNSQRDTADAQLALNVATTVLQNQGQPTLHVSSFGSGPPAGTGMGFSPVRGIEWMGNSNASDTVDGNLCPPPNGNCSPQIVEQTWRASVPEALYEIAQVAGPSWSLYNQSMDDSYGNGMWAALEAWESAPGSGPPPPERIYLNFYQSDKWAYNHPNCYINSWYWNGVAIGLYTGSTADWRPQFESYLQCRPYSDEYDSYMMEAGINLIINPPKLQLVDVPVSVSSCTAAGCQLSWTVPAGAVSYRMKAHNDGKQIVKWLNFDNVHDPGATHTSCPPGEIPPPEAGDRSGCYQASLDPATHWPWFSADDLSNLPTPGTPGTQQTCTVGAATATCTYPGFNTVTPTSNTFAIKALVATSGPVDVTPPVVAITAPTSGAAVSGTISIAATATDDGTVADVAFQVDGSPIGAPDLTAPYAASLNTASLTNGTHTISAVATDAAGNSTRASITVAVSNAGGGDTTPPTVAMTAPGPGTIVSGTITISANATDDVAVADVAFQVDGNAIGSPVLAAPYAVPFNTTQLSNGAHTFTAIAADLAGNTARASVTVTVNNSSGGDTTPPTVSITAPASGATVSGTVAVAANATDDGAVANVTFQVDGNIIGVARSAPYTVSLDSTTLINGPHSLVAIATDLAGNAARASESFSVKNSSSFVGITITSPASGATVAGVVTITVSTTAPVSGVQLQIDGANLGSELTSPPYTTLWDTSQVSNGPHTITAIANGNAVSIQVQVRNSSGNAAQVASAAIDSKTKFVVDLQDLWSLAGCSLCSFRSAADVIPGQTTQVVLRAGSATPVADQILLRQGTLDGTVVSWQGSQFIMQGNSGTLLPTTILVLTNVGTQRTNFSNALQPGQAVAVRGLLFRTGPEGGPTIVAREVAFRPGGGSPPPNPGSGDTIPPTVSITAPSASAQLSGTVTLMANASDDVAVASVAFQVDGNPIGAPLTIAPYAVALNTTSLSNGQHTLTAVASDLAGNTAQASITITINNPTTDTAPPTVAITAPATGATVSGTVPITATAADDVAVASVTFEVDGNVIGVPLLKAPYSASLNTTKLSNGLHSLSAVAVDLAGNRAQAVVAVTVNNGGGDTTPPTVSITAPAPGATVSGTIAISANATDDVAVASVTFQVDGNTIGTPVLAPPYNISLNTATIANGLHTIAAVAADRAGNTAQASVSVTVANAVGSGNVTVSPITLTWGSQVVGSTSPAQTLTLTNGTSNSVLISGITASGDFAQSNSCPASLTTGSSCQIQVTFTPTTTGTRTGTLTVTDNAPTSPQTVTLSGTGTNTACPAGQWCQIVPNGTVHGEPDNGWNLLIFSHDTGKFYLYADSATPPTVDPWENAFWSYTVQGGAASSNPWTKYTDCGDTALNSIRQKSLFLATNIGAADTSLSFNIEASGTLENPAFPQSGTIFVDDEAMNFTQCSSVGGAGTCQPGATSLTLSGLTRGVRQAAGYTAATTHAAGAISNLACPAPTVAGNPTTDHPPSRHPVGATTYDAKRGRIWQAWGYQENYSLQDTWYLCIFQTSSCSAAQVANGWQRLALSPSSGGGQNPNGYQENAMIYDPDNDVIVEFGGLRFGTIVDDMYVFCFNTTAYGCTTTNKWIKITPHDGTPGLRTEPRMVYDTWNHRILVYGGIGALGGGKYHTVAIYNSATGDWCVSDTSQGGSNAASCSQPTISGPTPPGLKGGAWAFDTKRGKAVLYGGPGGVYTYDAAQNRWTLTGVAGGPTLAEFTDGTSWAYDDIHDTFVYVTMGNVGTQTWELPGSALGP